MMERLLLFGTGQFYIRRREALSAFLGQDEVVGFLDNRAQERRMMDGLPVYLPEELSQIAYECPRDAGAAFRARHSLKPDFLL